MSSMFLGASRWSDRSKSATSASTAIPGWLRVGAIVLRTTLIVSLVIVILHLSMPDRSAFWSALERPPDLVRIMLGLVASAWIAFQVFTMPKDADAYRTWLYLGLAAVPFTLICIVGIW